MTSEKSSRPPNRPVRIGVISASPDVPAVRLAAAPNVAPTSNSTRMAAHFHPGDLVVVRPLHEILQTLSPDGTLDGLPVMPEMLSYCGNTYRVMQRVVQACVDGAFLPVRPESYVRQFINNDVVTLEGVRCSGQDHGGCQRGCAIFWKEAWLQTAGSVVEMARTEFIQPDLRTTTENGLYFCQSSEFLQATQPLSFAQRVRNCFKSVAVGNLSSLSMVRRISRWMWWKLRQKLLGEHAKGTQANTPTEVLNLQPGELVEVKSLTEIAATLNREGRNRGLHFSGDQRPYCGGRYRVRSRADNYIAEGTGEMKHFRNTVILEDVLCDSSYYAFGGCCRSDLLYWRECWLKRVAEAPRAKDEGLV